MADEKITINGIDYIRTDLVISTAPAPQMDGMNYVMVRTSSYGVFCGYMKDRNGQEVTLLKARRIWYWEGAATLSQLAQEGTKKPEKCKFPCEVNEVLLLDAVEILNVTEGAQKSIAKVPVWGA